MHADFTLDCALSRMASYQVIFVFLLHMPVGCIFAHVYAAYPGNLRRLERLKLTQRAYVRTAQQSDVSACMRRASELGLHCRVVLRTQTHFC